MLTEDGVIRAQVNNDPTSVILHHIRDIHIINNTTNATQYKVNIEYAI